MKEIDTLPHLRYHVNYFLRNYENGKNSKLIKTDDIYNGFLYYFFPKCYHCDYYRQNKPIKKNEFNIILANK